VCRHYSFILIFCLYSFIGFGQELKYREDKDKAKGIAYNGAVDKAMLIFQSDLDLTFEASNDSLSTISKNNGIYKVPIAAGSQMVTIKAASYDRIMLNFVYDNLGILRPKGVRYFIIEKPNKTICIANITKDKTTNGTSDFPGYDKTGGFLFFYTTAIPDVELLFKEKNGYVTKVVKDVDRYQLNTKACVPIELTISAKGYDDIVKTIDSLKVKGVKYYRLYSLTSLEKTTSSDTSLKKENNKIVTNAAASIVELSPLEQHRMYIQKIKDELAKYKGNSPYGAYKIDTYSGDKYSGEYDNYGNKNGNGILTGSNGSIYKGTFNNSNFWQGQGIEVNSSYGYTYVGEYNNSRKEGKGTLTYNNGTKYEGTFKNDNFWQGQGTEVNLSYGYTYVGEYNNSRKEGKGTLTYNNGSKYEGTFKNDNFWQGQGTEVNSSYGYTYIGEYNNSRKEGKGTLTYNNGSKYDGVFKNDNFWQGQGTEVNSSYGYTYVGEYNNSRKEGKGTLTYNNGNKYEGVFKNDNFWSGQADEIDNYGNKFVGQYKNGQAVK